MYGGPIWDMCRRVKNSEERDTKCWAYKHVIVCCAAKENAKLKILPAPVESKMLPGCAYLVFTIGGFEDGVFKKHAWLMTDVLILDTPFALGAKEKPTRGPTQLNSSFPGHKKLLTIINSMRTKHADSGQQPPDGYTDGLSLCPPSPDISLIGLLNM